MKSTVGTSGVLSLFLLATPHVIIPGSTLVNGAPTEGDKNLYHVGSRNAQHGGAGWADWHSTTPVDVDVVVVGGGHSGMAAVNDLQKAGLEVVVLEARDRLGGRSRTHKLTSGPGIIELGATWINNITQPEVWALTQEFGLETLEQYMEGGEVLQGPDGEVFAGDTEETEESIALNEQVLAVMAAMTEAVEAIDVRTFDEFTVDEDVTLEEWLIQKGLWEHPFIQGFVAQLSAIIVGHEPRDIGAHYFFDYVKSGGGFGPLSTEGKLGAQSRMLKEGTTAIATKIAETMPPGSVLLNNPVTSITQKDDTVLVATETGKQFRAKKAILAIIPIAYSNIEFSPSLPADKQGLASASKGGIYAKVVFTYDEPWWRSAGLVGKFISMVGPIRYSWELCDPSLDQYSLTLFTAGDMAAEWHALPESEKVEAFREHLVTLVGEELAARARDTLEVNYFEWTKQNYIHAGPTSSLGPGMLRKYGDTLRATFQNLHFAGTETAYEWKGYLEGAVTAGKRAANEVSQALAVGGKE